MGRYRNCLFAFLLGCCAPLLIWVGLGKAYQSRKAAMLTKTVDKLACSVDTDCPVGFICVDGHCVPIKS